jgi:hypothetical protein
MTSLDRRVTGAGAYTRREPCMTQTCFATFSGTTAGVDEIRYCNRPGPEGGHAHRWNGDRWSSMTGAMEHDRP